MTNDVTFTTSVNALVAKTVNYISNMLDVKYTHEFFCTINPINENG